MQVCLAQRDHTVTAFRLNFEDEHLAITMTSFVVLFYSGMNWLSTFMVPEIENLRMSATTNNLSKFVRILAYHSV